MPLSIDEVKDWLFIALTFCKFHHAYSTSCAIKAVEKFLLHFFPTINGTRLKVCVPIKSIALKGADKLFGEVVSVCPNIVAHFNEVCHMLFWAFLTIELLKFLRLIIGRHFQAINPCRAMSYICQGRFVETSYLYLMVP